MDESTIQAFADVRENCLKTKKKSTTIKHATVYANNIASKGQESPGDLYFINKLMGEPKFFILSKSQKN